MIIIEKTTEFNIEEGCCVAIGKFDGIHKGHQSLLKYLEDYRKDGYKIVIFTFDPSPVAFFSNQEYKGVTTRDEKRHIFERLGVDVLIEYPLTKESASISPEDFIEDILIGRLHVKCVVCGKDFTFGREGKGNTALLQAYGSRRGFDVKVCDKVKQDGVEISSSLIRNVIEEGKMEEAARYIGAYYSVTGVVSRGRQIGRTLGMPTVNIVPEADKLLPPYGVYEAVISYNGGHYRGITNVGVKPTVTDEKKPVVETYIFDFDEQLYDRVITVNLIRMVRHERKFDSLDELKEQIKNDIESVKSGL